MELRGAVTEPSGRPYRLHARTVRSFLVTESVVATVGCLFGMDLYKANGWQHFELLMALIAAAALVIGHLASTTEWTVADGELRRRRWLSRPGSLPSVAMNLGPDVSLVRETITGWRLRPKGPAVGLRPWETHSLVGAMAAADVRIRDWEHSYRTRSAVLMTALFVWAVGFLAYSAAMVFGTPWPTRLDPLPEIAGLVAFGCFWVPSISLTPKAQHS